MSTPAPVLDEEYFTDGAGPETQPITFTVENDTVYDRTEVVGVMVPFPDDGNGIAPEEIGNYHLFLEGGRETIGQGNGSYNAISATYSTTLPWTGPLNTVTANSGNILAGSCRLTVYCYNPWPALSRLTITDTPAAGGATGSFVNPAIVSSSINYSTGVITVTFSGNYKPENGKPIRLEYKFANPVKYPTQWTVLRLWPNGRVRQAKAWIGQASGVGVLIPKKIATITATTPSSTQTPEYTRGYLRVGYDETLNASLPTYAQHSEMAAALDNSTGQITSQVFDSNNLDYYANMLSGMFEEYVVEDPANNSGKGWMKVIQRRNYHVSSLGTSTFGSLTRDFLSSTTYFYVPHNSRLLDVEVRLGNDYQGADPIEHAFTENLSPATGNGATRNFSVTLVNCFPSGDGIYGNVRRGRVKIYQGSLLVAKDTNGNGVLVAQNSSGCTGTVNYATGAVSIVYAVTATPPANAEAMTCQYKSHYIKIGTATGVDTLNYNLPIKASQYSLHVRVGSGSSAVYEGWDGGGLYNGAISQIVPYVYTAVQPAQIAAAALPGTATGTLATNLVPGTVGFFVGATDAGIDATFYCRDDGVGGLAGRNVTTGTIDYVTGAYSITFASTPTSSHNLYATYGRTTAARYISGSVNYSTGALAVTTSQSVPASTPVFVSYVRNRLSAKNHDPNMHPLGSVGLNKWVMLFNGTRFTDLFCEAKDTYLTSTGGTTTKFATILNSGSIPGGGTDPSAHEHMHDGTSVNRLLFLYTGTGASAGDNNTWTAKKLQPISPIPTLDAYNSTHAIGLLEGSLAIVTPEQKVESYQLTKRSYTEDLARDHRFIVNKGSEAFSAVTKWNNGHPNSGGPAGEVHGSRSHLAWMENVYTGVSAGGAQRVGIDFTGHIIYSQAWQAVRYLYQASLFPTVRPGSILWNIANCFKWEDRAYQKYIPGAGGGTVVQAKTARTEQYGYYVIGNQEWLGRGWKFGWQIGNVSVTNNSNVIRFNAFTSAGDQTLANNWSSSSASTLGISCFTPVGLTQVDGRRRIAIQGSVKNYVLTEVHFDEVAGKWTGTLDTAYRGATSTAASYGLYTDPITGVDIVAPRNDPRTFPAVRVGCGQWAKQHGIENESTSHQAANVVFDTWNVCGSWMLWDIFRHSTEWNMASVKDFSLHVNGFYSDQMRVNAWTFRSVITGYAGVKYLTGKIGFEFLTDPDYGSAANRYADFLRGRWTQWLDLGARGEMDPIGVVAVNGRERIKDIRVSSSSYDQADWSNLSRIGSRSSIYGGDGTRTEAQVKIDNIGFDYVSVWEIGYLAPWATATWREFRNDTTVVNLPFRVAAVPGEVPIPFSQVMQRIFNGYAAFVTDYCHITKVQNTPPRYFPGFVAVTLSEMPAAGHPAPNMIGSAGKNVATPLGQEATGLPGTPLTFVRSSANQGVLNPLYTPENWAVTVNEAQADNNYIAQQIYYLRGACSSLTSGLVQDPIDRLAHMLPLNRGYTSFELGWDFPGIAGYGAIPACNTNNPNNGTWNCLYAPGGGTTISLGEAFNMVGMSHRNQDGLTFVTGAFLMHVARFHASAARRAKAGDLLNRYFWQSRAISIISGVYDLGVNESSQGQPIEQNVYTGPITGGFPYSTETNNQPVDRWYDLDYSFRRRLNSGTTHSEHIGGTDILKINLTAYGIESKTFQNGSTDTRVVRQLIDGSNQVCESIVRKAAGNQWWLFVKLPATVAASQAIQASPSEAWYVYYGNGSAASSSWVNTASIDGPYSSDVSTKVLWNQIGNFSTDGGPNNWPLATSAMLEPDYVDGPFGGAIGISKDNFDVVVSQQAAAVAKSGTHYLGSSFSFDFQFRIEARKFEVDRTLNYGLFSIIDNAVFPITAYIENSSRRVIFSVSTGGTTGFTITNAAAAGPARQVIGTGNGVLTSFAATLGTNLIPGTVSISTGTGAVYGKDNGAGSFTGTGISGSSTINYQSGAVTIVTSAAVPNAVAVVAYYTQSVATWSLDNWNHASVSYNGQRFLVTINGQQVGTALASGVLQPLPAGSSTSMAVGSLYTPGSLFTAWSNSRLAEFRISSTDRLVPRKTTTPLVITALGEESLVVTNTHTSPSVAAYVAPRFVQWHPADGYVAKTVTLSAAATLDGTVLTTQNNEVLLAADGNVAVGTEIILNQVDAVISGLDVTGGTISVAANVASLVSDATGNTTQIPVDGTVVLVGTTSVDVDANILSLGSASISVAAYVAANVESPEANMATVVASVVVEASDGEVAADADGYVAQRIETDAVAVDVQVASRQEADGPTVVVALSLLQEVDSQVEAAVRVDDLTSSATVGAALADIPSVNPSIISADSHVAGLFSATGPNCEALIYATPSPHQEPIPVDAAIVVNDVSSTFDADGAVAIRLQTPPEHGVAEAAIQAEREVPLSIIGSILKNDNSFLQTVETSIQTADISVEASTECSVTSAGQAAVAIDSAIRADNTQQSISVEARVDAAIKESYADVEASIQKNSNTVEQSVDAQIVLSHQTSITCDIAFEELWVRPAAVVEALIFTGLMEERADVEATVAVPKTATGQSVDAMIAKESYQKAVCRAYVVLPSLLTLNASAVNLPHTTEIK